MYDANFKQPPVISTESHEDEARRMESDAKGAGEESARGLWADAARAWHARIEEAPGDAFAASRYLACARKAGFDPEVVAGDAQDLVTLFPNEGWVQKNAAWVMWDLARARCRRPDPAGAARALREAFGLTQKDKDSGVLLACLAGVMRPIERAAGRLPRHESRSVREELRLVLREHGSGLVRALSAEENRLRDPKKVSPLDAFYFFVRKLGESLGDGELIEAYMSAAVERSGDNQWFHQAYVRAALWRGDLEEARRRGKQAFRRLPGSWAIAAARAEVESTAGELDRGVAILTEACLGADEPWPWRALGDLLAQALREEESARCFACGLAHHDPRDAGKVWRMHHTLADLHQRQGRAREAAQEAWLAREAREIAGWRIHRDQETWIEIHEDEIAPLMTVFDHRPPAEVRREAMGAYRYELEKFRLDASVRVRVTRYDDARGFGFVALDDGRTAFLHRSALGSWTPEEGAQVRAVVVPGLDRKKGKQGWKVSWLEAPSSNQPIPRGDRAICP